MAYHFCSWICIKLLVIFILHRSYFRMELDIFESVTYFLNRFFMYFFRSRELLSHTYIYTEEVLSQECCRDHTYNFFFTSSKFFCALNSSSSLNKAIVMNLIFLITMALLLWDQHWETSDRRLHHKRGGGWNESQK